MDDFSYNTWDDGGGYQSDSDFDTGNFDLQSQLDGQEGFMSDGGMGIPWEDNFSNVPMEGWGQSGTDWGGVDQQLGTNFNNINTGWGQSGGGISDVLGKLFQNPQLLSKGLGALFEGRQNKKYASSLRDAASKVQSASDPFASQRGQYQQLLSQTYTDPNVVLGRPEIQAQLSGMRQQMERRDAAAGRRSQYGDRENQLAMQAAGLVDKYRQGLVPLTGAGMQPNTQALSQLFQQAAKPDAQGYASPLLSVLGNATQGQSISDLLSSLRG